MFQLVPAFQGIGAGGTLVGSPMFSPLPGNQWGTVYPRVGNQIAPLGLFGLAATNSNAETAANTGSSTEGPIASYLTSGSNTLLGCETTGMARFASLAAGGFILGLRARFLDSVTPTIRYCMSISAGGLNATSMRTADQFGITRASGTNQFRFFYRSGGINRTDIVAFNDPGTFISCVWEISTTIHRLIVYGEDGLTILGSHTQTTNLLTTQPVALVVGGQTDAGNATAHRTLFAKAWILSPYVVA